MSGKWLKDGVEVPHYEVPLRAYLERCGPVGVVGTTHSRRIHAISVVRAAAEGKEVPEPRFREHTEEELADAREAVWRVRHPGEWEALTEEERRAIHSGERSPL